MYYSLNIIVTGVGGQGLLTLSRLLIEAAKSKGLSVLAAETHGMSQRGGSVVVHVRLGSEITSPLIPIGGADMLISTELIETIRNLRYVNSNSYVITNTKIIYPAIPGVMNRVNEDQALQWLKKTVRESRLILVPASDIALKDVGFPQATNMVILGAATPLLKNWLDVEKLKELVSTVGRGSIREKNVLAFEKGMEYTCREYGLCV